MVWISVFLLFAGGLLGYFVGSHLSANPAMPLYGIGIGLLISLGVIQVEKKLRKVSGKAIIGGLIGLISGLIVANLLSYSMLLLPGQKDGVNPLIRVFINVVVGYIGLVMGVRKGEKFDLSELKSAIKKGPYGDNVKILDTSVIIDGRIADICETGFLEGTLIIPQFVLKELQHIADSSDSVKRNRGRRGLDILHKIQRNVDITTSIVDYDFPKVREVDAKLVELGKMLGAKLLTNDFNLNKVAELQGVPVLNINQLANAVKPVVLPGELMNVYILKEGKEYGQGVAYLDDGTMVVVDNARKHLGSTVEVCVTSVLQTTAGRMIFTRLKEDASREEGVRSSA
jgi:uncharacterized protein YacL